MLTFSEYLREDTMMNYETIINLLKNAGYSDIKKISGVKIGVLTDGNRVKVLEDIAKKLHGTYDAKPGSDSSAGRVRVSTFSIVAKPKSRQGRASAGVDNEHTLVDYINEASKSGPINVIFHSGRKKFEVLGCVKATAVGSDTAGRKKADIVLYDKQNHQYPISIKKDNAEYWESADASFSTQAAEIIDKAVKAGVTNVKHMGSYVMIEPNIAVEATREEKMAVVFGSDILNRGAVVTKTFSSSSFKQDEDTHYIDCTDIITSLSDVIGTDKDVYFLIRNDKTRKSIKGYPGVRVLAAYKKRINKNVKVVSR